MIYLSGRVGYDSADGTLLAFGSDTNMERIKRWFGAT